MTDSLEISPRVKCISVVSICLVVIIALVIVYSWPSMISTRLKPVVYLKSGRNKTEKRPKVKQSSEVRYHSKYSNKNDLRKLGAIVQRRIRYIQNPKSCQTRKKLYCQLHICGTGCKIHTMTNCLVLAYAMNRTMVTRRLDVLEPLSSTCTNVSEVNQTPFAQNHTKCQVVKLHLLGNRYKPDFYPPAVPDDLYEKIRQYHDKPFLWWAGQFASYVFRVEKASYIKWIREDYLRDFQQPIVGIHVRRTDKLRRDAKLHTIEEYMVHVERWFESRPGLERRVFLATDEPAVLKELPEKYPHYKVVSNITFSSNAVVQKRKSILGRIGIIHDIYLLSKCDFVVCTFSSNVCSITLQLITAERGNVTDSVVSLDRSWFFWGWWGKREGGGKPKASAKMPNYEDDLRH